MPHFFPHRCAQLFSLLIETVRQKVFDVTLRLEVAFFFVYGPIMASIVLQIVPQ